MAYIYRYIDLKKREVCYIGKVTKDPDVGYDPLTNRHKQHMGEEWYKNIGDENLILQYIGDIPHIDADILETWLIGYYGKTGQLYNIAKQGWGESKIDLYPVYGGRWRNYGQNRIINHEEVRKELEPLASALERMTEGYEEHLEAALEWFCDKVREIAKDLKKTYLLDRWDMQEDFTRVKE